MKIDETIDSNDLEETAEELPEGDALVPVETADESKKRIIQQAEKSARKIIEERLERKRLRHEVDYLSDLDDEDEVDLDILDDEFKDEE